MGGKGQQVCFSTVSQASGQSAAGNAVTLGKIRTDEECALQGVGSAAAIPVVGSDGGRGERGVGFDGGGRAGWEMALGSARGRGLMMGCCCMKQGSCNLHEIDHFSPVHSVFTPLFFYCCFRSRGAALLSRSRSLCGSSSHFGLFVGLTPQPGFFSCKPSDWVFIFAFLPSRLSERRRAERAGGMGAAPFFS